MMGLLIIIGFPKIVIGVEYLTLCPVAPYVPLYLLVSGVVGVSCPLYSVYVWMCVFDRTSTHRENTVWMLIWTVLALAIPVIQVAGGPYIIYIYSTTGNYSANCDVLNYGIGERNNTNRYLQSEDQADYDQNSSLSTDTLAVFNSSLISNPEYTFSGIKNESDFQPTTRNSSSCVSCDRVVMECAIVTVVIEYTFVTLPMIVMSIAVISFRTQYSKGRGSCTCC
ncbi:uncharacterized protein LOC121384044 isoform X2 [Gigantopelta aegis]|nr:uncharacterized protein LOC121384044 isoform X2 [Gigantopelta aegis]